MNPKFHGFNQAIHKIIENFLRPCFQMVSHLHSTSLHYFSHCRSKASQNHLPNRKRLSRNFHKEITYYSNSLAIKKRLFFSLQSSFPQKIATLLLPFSFSLHILLSGISNHFLLYETKKFNPFWLLLPNLHKAASQNIQNNSVLLNISVEGKHDYKQFCFLMHNSFFSQSYFLVYLYLFFLPPINLYNFKTSNTCFQQQIFYS